MLFGKKKSPPSTSLTVAETVLALTKNPDCGATPPTIECRESLDGVVGRLSDMLKRFKNEFRVEGLSAYRGLYEIGVFRSSGSEMLVIFGVFGS